MNYKKENALASEATKTSARMLNLKVSCKDITKSISRESEFKSAVQIAPPRASELDPDKWIPDPQRDEERIFNELHSYVVSAAECCGGQSEETVDALALYTKVIQNGIIACKEDIQGYFSDMYHAVHGEPEKYLSESPETIALIKLTCAPTKYSKE